MYKSSAMLITPFTDASVCHQHRIAAYAIWAKYDGRAIRFSGVLKSGEGKLLALGAAANEALDSGTE